MYCPLNRGIALHAVKKYDEAEKALFRAYQFNPRNVHNNYHLGKFYQEVKKDHARAIAFFRVAVENTNGRHPQGDIAMAESLIQLKRQDEARSSYQRALSVEPQNTAALFNWARMEFDLGKIGKSMEVYRQLVQ